MTTPLLTASDVREHRPTAEFSPCRTYRYVLRRTWSAGPAVGFILLNPSTADETENDPTIRRCIGYAKAWGYGSLVLGNLFALRSTDPKGLRQVADPVGPDNDDWLLRIAKEAGGKVICGWGNHGALNGRGRAVAVNLAAAGVRPLALTVTTDGSPGHPLYLRGGLKPLEL